MTLEDMIKNYTHPNINFDEDRNIVLAILLGSQAIAKSIDAAVANEHGTTVVDAIVDLGRDMRDILQEAIIDVRILEQ